jgi:Tfp pilus assembly protein PilF
LHPSVSLPHPQIKETVMSALFSKTFRAGLASATALSLLAGCGDTKRAGEIEDLSRQAVATFPPSVTREVDPRTQIAPLQDEQPDVPVPAEQLVPEPPARPVPTTYSEFMQEGRFLMGRGDHVGALANFAKAAEKKPELALPRLQMARALLGAGDHGQARGHVEAALELDASSTDAWNTMGRVELAEGDREAAIASFQRAVDEDEDNSYAWNNLGYVLIEENRFEEAARALESATSGGKPTSYMWNNLGMAYEHLDMITEARAAYRQAADSGSSKAQANLARLEGVISLVRDGEEIDAGATGTQPQTEDNGAVEDGSDADGSAELAPEPNS